ncbi:hypothetical protein ACIA5E_16950 [Nocardia asteroides]
MAVVNPAEHGGHTVFADALDTFVHGVAVRHGLPFTAGDNYGKGE